MNQQELRTKIIDTPLGSFFEPGASNQEMNELADAIARLAIKHFLESADREGFTYAVPMLEKSDNYLDEDTVLGAYQQLLEQKLPLFLFHLAEAKKQVIQSVYQRQLELFEGTGFVTLPKIRSRLAFFRKAIELLTNDNVDGLLKHIQETKSNS